MITNIICFEKVNMHKLNVILSHQEYVKEFMRPITLDENKPYQFYFSTLEDYAKLYDSNIDRVPVQYIQKSLKIGQGKKRIYTRKCAEGQLSLQSIHREIRGTISKEYYYDIDMVNAHPTILKFLCEEANSPDYCDDPDDYINTTYLNDYLKNRNKIIQDIHTLNPNVAKEDIKILLLSIMNGGNEKLNMLSHKNEWLKKYVEEMNNIHNAFWNWRTDLQDSIIKERKAKGKEYNYKGSLINYLLCEMENKILMEIFKYLIGRGLIKKVDTQGKLKICSAYDLDKYDGYDCVLCFDGIMISKETFTEYCLVNPNFDLSQLLTDIENHIYTRLNIRVKFNSKEMMDFDNLKSQVNGESFNTNIWDSENSPESKASDKQPTVENPTLENNPSQTEVLHFNADDSYYWMDFCNELFNKTWNDLEDAIDYCEANINRVMIITVSNEMFIKKDSDEPYHFITELPNNFVKYKETIETKVKGRTFKVEEEAKISFKKLYNTELVNFVKIYNNLVVKPLAQNEDAIEQNKNSRNFNTWSGFKAKLVKKVKNEKIKNILDHIEIVWANHDKKMFKYICKWLQNIFATPFKKNKVALGFYSKKQQIGKSILVDEFLIPFIFGKKLAIVEDGLKFVNERFNNRLMGKLFMCCEELNNADIAASGYHNTFDTLKRLITGTTIQIEYKGGAKITVDDFCNYIFFTNNPYSIKIEQHDARYCMIECNGEKQGDFQYFKELAATFNQETADHFFTYIHNGLFLDDGEDIEIRNIPETKLKADMKMSSLTSSIRFLHKVKEVIECKETDDDMPNWEIDLHRLYNEDPDHRISSTILFNLYKQYCIMENEKYSSSTLFGRQLTNYIEKIRSNGFKYLLDSLKL